MPNDVKFRAIAPQFVVPDVRRTAEWYRDNLGFQILGYFFDEPPVYCIVGRGDITIHFGKGDSDQTVSNTAIRQDSMDAYVLVTGIDELYKELVSRGVSV